MIGFSFGAASSVDGELRGASMLSAALGDPFGGSRFPESSVALGRRLAGAAGGTAPARTIPASSPGPPRTGAAPASKCRMMVSARPAGRAGRAEVERSRSSAVFQDSPQLELQFGPVTREVHADRAGGAELRPKRRFADGEEIDVIRDGANLRWWCGQVNGRYAGKARARSRSSWCWARLNRLGNWCWISISGRRAATSRTKLALRNRLRSRDRGMKAFCARSMDLNFQ